MNDEREEYGDIEDSCDVCGAPAVDLRLVENRDDEAGGLWNMLVCGRCLEASGPEEDSEEREAEKKDSDWSGELYPTESPVLGASSSMPEDRGAP